MASGTVYLVPVGLGEAPWQGWLAPAAREIACGLDYFVAEKAKSARAALKAMEIGRALQTIRIAEMPQQPAAAHWDELLAPVLDGTDCGVMSEAGCPGVADPGAALVLRAHELGIRVVPLVGASAVLLALMASGLNGQSFAFHGYLPVKEASRRQRILELEADSRRQGRTQIFIETPYRNIALFETLLAACAPQTLLCVASVLTLPGERIDTLRIEVWRRRQPPEFERRPTVFLLLAQ